MRQVCPDCGGTGKIEKPVSMTAKEFFTCETCEGTGYLGGEYDKVITRLDKIIEILSKLEERRK